jgi:hypothetical protein
MLGNKRLGGNPDASVRRNTSPAGKKRNATRFRSAGAALPQASPRYGSGPRAGPIEVAHLFFADGSTTRMVPFAGLRIQYQVQFTDTIIQDHF